MGRLFPAGYRYLLYIDIIKKYISSLKKRPVFDLNLFHPRKGFANHGNLLDKTWKQSHPTRVRGLKQYENR